MSSRIVYLPSWRREVGTSAMSQQRRAGSVTLRAGPDSSWYIRAVIRVALVPVVLLVAACGASDELEKKVTKLEGDVATLRKEREFLELKQVQLLKEVGELEKKIDELKKPAYPSYRMPARKQADPQKTYALSIDPMDPSDGASDALVTIVEGYEYACPFCERARATMDELKKKYGKDLRWVGKQLVVHPTNATAAALAICAANKQHKFAAMDRLLWEDGFKDRKFDQNNCWSTAAGCPVVEGFARKAGADIQKFRDDMKTCEPWLKGNMTALAKFGANATPTFFINGRYMSGAMPADNFAVVIDEEMTKAKARVQQGTPRAGYYDKWVVVEGEQELGP
jgi:protein-disulfide isomerase